MKKLKVMTVVGTRPEIIRLSRIIDKLDRYCDHILVHTGQNYDYELNELFFKDLDIRAPDYFLNAAGENSSETIGKIIIAIDKLLEETLPEALFVLGDTNSCLGIIAGKRRKIPIFHYEAGNRCYDMRVPEEINRRIVDHTADVNFTYSSIAREALLREGLPPDLIINVGSPMLEILTYYGDQIAKSEILKVLQLDLYQYYLVSSHREENIASDRIFFAWVDLLNNLADRDHLPIIVSTHPRTRKRIDTDGVKFHKLVRLIKPVCFTDYIKLQTSSKAVLSDSGTISEESSILNFPALNIRECQERHEALEEGSVMFVGTNKERVFQGLSILASQTRGFERVMMPVQDYLPANVSEKIIRLIISYTDYVNRTIWKKC